MRQMTPDELNQKYYEDGLEDGKKDAKLKAIIAVLKIDYLNLSYQSRAQLIVSLLTEIDGRAK